MNRTWQRAVVVTHRWLGTGLGLLFAVWFASGIVMMYARMPRLSAADRKARLEPLDLATARYSPQEIVTRQQIDGVEEIRVGMALGRPVYRFLSRTGSTAVFADTGERLDRVGPAAALAQARMFAPEHARTVRYDARLDAPDQWTLEIAHTLPAHRIVLGDRDDTYVYVSERSGEVVLRATARDRRAAYAGAVLHWLYFAPFRRHGALWSQAVVWLSAAGSVMCLLGLIWGVTVGIRSPYRGWMRWHHYAGLIFGVATFTWIFSGFLSMDPWDWHPSTSPTREQRAAFSGGALEGVALDSLRDAAVRRGVVKEIEVVPFRGRARLIADAHAEETLARADLLAAARGALPGAPLVDAAWLADYDAYYYDRARELPLPVLRVRFGDPRATWLYVDPNRGTIARKEERLTRVNRWLYHGLHSLDLPFLYYRRPLWDVVVIALSLGGLASVATAAGPACRRLGRLLASAKL